MRDTADAFGYPASVLAGALRRVEGAASLPDDALAIRAASLADEIDQRLVHRVAALGGPLLVVVGGPTGVGKSTLVNSLVGRVVSPADVRRPTTRTPLLVHHPDDRAWFTEAHRALPGAEVALVADEQVPPGLALLDAPDPAAMRTERPESASPPAVVSAAWQGAELWLAVTSAARYADAVPWGVLRRVADRRTPVAVVLDRVAPDAVPEVTSHLAQLMQAQGLGDSPLLVVTEQPVRDGLLACEAVATVRAWLEALVADPERRALGTRASLAGGVADLSARVHALAEDAGAQDLLLDDPSTRALERFDAAAAELLGHLGPATTPGTREDLKAS